MRSPTTRRSVTYLPSIAFLFQLEHFFPIFIFPGTTATLRSIAFLPNFHLSPQRKENLTARNDTEGRPFSLPPEVMRFNHLNDLRRLGPSIRFVLSSFAFSAAARARSFRPQVANNAAWEWSTDLPMADCARFRPAAPACGSIITAPTPHDSRSGSSPVSLLQ